MPVGLPVQTGFIQNNFINTNFIIGNENCNSNEIVESAQDPVDQDPDVKPTFLTKPLDELDSPGDTHDKGFVVFLFLGIFLYKLLTKLFTFNIVGPIVHPT